MEPSQIPLPTDVQLFRIQIISIVGSLGLLAFILNLLRTRRLREEYSLLWLLGGLAFLTLSIFRDALTTIAYAIGVAYPPAALFLALIMGAYLMLLHFSLAFSKAAEKSKAVAQEVALLKLEVERLRAQAVQSAPEAVQQPE
jgi:hypothetical protein